MKYKTLIIILFVYFNLQYVTSSAQQTTLDSLKQEIRTANQDTNLVKSLNNLALYYHGMDLDSSLTYAEKSLELALQLNYRQGEAEAYISIGYVFVFRGNFKRTLECWNKSLKISEELDDKIEIGRNLGNIGIIYMYQGNYPKAMEYYQKSLKINEELSDKIGIAKNLGNIGIIYMYQSSYSKALEYYQKSLIINKELDDKNSIAINLGNIGNVYSSKSDFPKAIEYYQKSLKINKELEDKSGIAYNLKGIGNIYWKQSNYTKALEYYQEALKKFEELEDKSGISSCLHNIGLIYNSQGNYSKALEYYQESLKINKQLANKSEIALSLGNLANICTKQNNFPKALEYCQEALKINEEIGNKLGIAQNIANIGNLHNRNQEYSKAIEYVNKAIKINEEIGIVKTFPYQYLSISYWALNNMNEAAIIFNNILNINNKKILLNFPILPENAKQLYFGGLEQDYWKYNSFVLQNLDSFPSMIENVYNNTLKNKGLLLKSNTAMRNAIYLSQDSTLIEEYDNWIILKCQIAKKYSEGKDATQLENLADSLETSIVKKSNEFSDFKKVQNITWKQVQASLKENEVAIEFLHFPLLNPDSSYFEFTNQIQYVALVVTKNNQYPEMIPLFEEKQLEQIIGKFGGNNYSYINSIYGKNTEVNKALYNLIWAPLEESLDSAKKIYLSPSGLLHKISFSAIAKEQNVYLCDNYNIELKSSSGKLVMPENSAFNTDITCSLYGGINYNSDSTDTEIWKYLEGTKTEVKKIESILNKKKLNVNFALDQFATEEMFKKLASNSNIIHIATHGFFYPDPEEIKEDSEMEEKVEYGDLVFRGGNRGFGVESFVKNINPLMRSGLVFAGANDVWSKQNQGKIDDGVLTAQEVSNIDMRKTKLVVMSACETGLGDIKGSEGVYGLQRAFKMAGVDYLIMSLWQVPDKETEEFMTTFYKKLIKQKDIKEAFNQTQKEIRSKYDPYFWAAFVLIE